MISIFGGRELWRQAVQWLAVCVLAVGAGAVHQWQTGRIGVLGDYAYIVDTAWRIAQGEVMYRDFGLPHSPLTFHVQATLIKVFGFSYGVTAWYCTVVNVAYVVLTYGLVRELVAGWGGVALCVPLVWLAPHCIYPHPFYDSDTCLLILLNLNLLRWVAVGRVGVVVAFMGGVTAVLPALGKQNVGYPYVVLVVLVVVWWGWLRGRWAGGRGGEWSQEESKEEGTEELDVVGLRWFGAGVAAGVVGAVVWLGLTCGLGNYWRWVFASASRRLADLTFILETYGNYESWALGGLMVLGWWLWQRKGEEARPFWVATASATLLLGPFVVVSAITWLCGRFFVGFDYPLLSLWVPVMILTLVVGLWQLPSVLSASQPVRTTLPWIAVILTFFSFLSQGYTRSSYGIWALFVLMVAYVVSLFGSDRRQPLVCWGIAIALTLAAFPYVYHNVRLRYVDHTGDVLQTAYSGPLRRFTVDSPYLSNFAELLDFVADRIPESEPVVCVPQEDPFYVMTGRRNPLPMVIFDRTATPFFPEDIVNEAERRQVKWVIVKRVLQMERVLAEEIAGIPEAFSKKYTTVARLSGYDILYRSAPAQAGSP